MINGGLVLEGGGMRGIYTAGALDCLIDNNIYFKDIFAVSAGACHACSYVSKQRGRAYKANITYLNDKRYASFRNLIKEGNYFAEDFVYHEIPDSLIPLDFDAMENSGMNFYAAVTNCRSGEAEYHLVKNYGSGAEIVRASSALPYLSKEIKLGNEMYLDGGISDAIPILQSIKSGNERNLIILTRDKEYIKPKNKAAALHKIRYKKYPKLADAMNSKHLEYNNTLSFINELEFSGKAAVIRPKSPPEVSRLERNTKKLKNLYEQGYKDASEKLNEITTIMTDCNK